MIISKQEFNNLKSRDDIPLKCKGCNNIFYGKKHKVMASIKDSISAKQNYDYCTLKCFTKTQEIKIEIECGQCHKKITKTPSEIKHSKHGKSFCSSSCSATYNNTHKTTGYRRSKLEKWLEIKLIKSYPNLEINFNKIDTINAELDIYIPPLKLAFELNGIFHYEPIYGKEKLDRTKNNDDRKFQACLERGIELCIIDVSKIKYFKENTSKPILEIVINLIDKKIGHPGQI